ncbi:MAG: Na/Pi cotransporter family protein, partial [Deltaproteobacteria bacterium]|nr:Na/Pi cotransporter family protein [Deltaproteobacteria bacterium]
METSSSSILIGGFVFFFFGLKLSREHLQLISGSRLRAILAKLTTNRLASLLFGALITVVLQSSGATSAMLVS